MISSYYYPGAVQGSQIITLSPALLVFSTDPSKYFSLLHLNNKALSHCIPVSVPPFWMPLLAQSYTTIFPAFTSCYSLDVNKNCLWNKTNVFPNGLRLTCFELHRPKDTKEFAHQSQPRPVEIRSPRPHLVGTVFLHSLLSAFYFLGKVSSTCNKCFCYFDIHKSRFCEPTSILLMFSLEFAHHTSYQLSETGTGS